jgi:hypothetical protein
MIFHPSPSPFIPFIPGQKTMDASARSISARRQQPWHFEAGDEGDERG